MRPRKIPHVCFDCGSSDLITTRVISINTKALLSETFSCRGCGAQPCEIITEPERLRALKLLKRGASIAPTYAPVVKSAPQPVEEFIELGGED